MVAAAGGGELALVSAVVTYCQSPVPFVYLRAPLKDCRPAVRAAASWAINNYVQRAARREGNSKDELQGWLSAHPSD